MRELGIVLRREFTERVRSKSFVVSTVLTPVLLSLFALGPELTDRLQGGESFRIAVLDASGAEGEAVVRLLQESSRDNGGDALMVDHVRATGPARDSLAAAVRNGSLDGFLSLPADVVDRRELELTAHTALPRRLTGRISGAVSTAVQGERLRRLGLRGVDLAGVIAPVRVTVREIEQAAEAEGSADAGLFLALIIGFFLYFLILLYGAQVMHSVQEEKTSRIAEVLVSSIPAGHLMLGKVFGVGATALLQVSIWAGLAWFTVGIRSRLASLGLPAEALDLLTGDAALGSVATSGLYMALGFFLYATLFAAVGAAAASTEDAQRFTLPLILPLFIPMFLAQAIVEAPDAAVARLLSWIPLTAPLVMPMRIVAGGGSQIEVAGTLLVLAASVGVFGWIAGKIYRVGILSAGARPGLRDLARWVRAA